MVMEREETATKRPYLRADARREMILEAAERIIARDGLAQLSMIGVAHEAHVSRQLIYRHFTSRSELLVGLVEHNFALIEGNFAEAVSEFEDPRELLRARFARAMQMPVRNQLLTRSVFSGADQLEPDLAPAVAQVRDRLISRWTSLGLPAYPDNAVGRARIWALFHAVFGLWDLIAANELSHEQAYEILMSMVDVIRDANIVN